MRKAISVVILTKNEEERIADCIKSVLSWADEVIVVDDESADNTVEIAKKLGTKVLIRKMDIEGKHRNWAYQQAKNEWVFSLDADERLTPELKKEIIEVLSSSPSHSAYTVPRKNFIGNYGSCGHLKNSLIHYTYRNWGDFLNKVNKQTTLEAIKWYKLSLVNPKKARYKMNLIHVLWRMLDRFIRTFLVKKGYRDGFVGFMVAYFSSFYQIVSYAKYKELIKHHKTLPNETKQV